ncbi:response regulator transcription factor [Silvimonas amylolytica]|uniref:DNA-binding response regulator n=1 Tax=Silvimonas amylolytica TaxID=449663 RepID=A0ABQ2PGU2_9NEIS|nr:response regulator transcription factor [Silvimonas amylolytica]GGP24420.1 DNA-binding response regulator [Silvimonas amylolytica]
MLKQPAHSVFIVDDHPAVCAALASAITGEDTLQLAGTAHTGTEALQRIQNIKPDLVILDLKLPDIDGLHLISRLRKSEATSKILVFSMLDPRMYLSRIMEAGGNGFVGKDQTVESVLSAALQILRGYNCFPSLDIHHTGRSDEGDPIKRLSQRELVVMLALARGMSNKELAGTLHLSEKTIASHKAHILEKLNLSNLAEVIEFARARQLLD